jgi:hypothetical protein
MKKKCRKYKNSDLREMIDVIRELLGKDPLYFTNGPDYTNNKTRFYRPTYSFPGASLFSSNGMKKKFM